MDQERIARARERLKELKAQANDKPERKGLGLKAELHPLFTGKQSSTPLEVENPNLEKFNKRGFAVNPYLSSVTTSRAKREFKFVEKGQYVAQAQELRLQREVAEKKRKLQEIKQKAGLVPDLEKGEDKYQIEAPPLVEWWDLQFLRNGDYAQIDETQISMYLQHHELIEAPIDKHMPSIKPLPMTKKEMKRKRKIERAERYEELQDKIKLGLEPPPPPKVKLSNMMNVLTNEALLDPTGTELRVRREIAQRKDQHEQTNQERKLTKEAKSEKLELKFEKDISRGFHSAIFAINKLEHPQHKFKVDQNAQQLKLVGTCLYGSSLALVIVEGGEKSIKSYKNLMTKRIKWDQASLVDGEELDLKHNKCQLIWEGQLKDFHFKKWGVFRATDDQGAIEYLQHFGVETYYREALTKIST